MKEYPSLPTCVCAFALLWVIARACHQSITIDEADTYLSFVAPGFPTHWDAASNNHVLNSMLMRAATGLFGATQFTIRLPALLGAVLYIGAANALCRWITHGRLLHLALLVCLIFNPFIQDHLVAARGYSLALAFLLVTISLAAFAWRRPRPHLLYAMCSVAAALSIAANFSFAIAAGVTLLLIFITARRRLPDPGHRVLALFVLPSLSISLVLTAYPILHWPEGQLIYGSYSMGETLGSILQASLYQLNPLLVNPLLYPVLSCVGRCMIPLLGILCLVQMLLFCRPTAAIAGPRAERLTGFASLLAGAVGLTFTLHWLAFHFFHLRLPKDRTAIYFVPLCTLIAGILFALPAASQWALHCRRAGAGILCVIATYFLFCLRLNHFREWKWDAETRNVYAVLSYYNHNYHLHEAATSWMYVAALNFYRVTSGRETLPEFVSMEQGKYPADRRLYILHYVFDLDYLTRQQLKIVYHGEVSDVVVAIRPELELSPAARCESTRDNSTTNPSGGL